MKNLKLLYSILLGLVPLLLFGQQSFFRTELDSTKVYKAEEFYPVKMYDHQFEKVAPKNIILMIGDGMGVSHVFAGLVANGGNLFLENFKQVGYSKTQSANRFVTDSGAGGTALATGYKTYNSAISMIIDSNGDTIAVKTVLELAKEKGKATGVVTTCALSHATPASFISHQPSRNNYEEIAAEILETEPDLFITGGSKNFVQRKDGRDLISLLQEKGYQTLFKMEDIVKVQEGKLAGLTSFAQNEPWPERQQDLPRSVETAINVLSKKEDGFFLIVEGSQIDWASHENNMTYLIREFLDFDQAIGKALDFASKDKETLIIVTADHETGGLAVTNGNVEKGIVHGEFISGGHTGVMVPVFSYGPGAEQFTGIIDNTDIAKKITSLLEQ